MRRLYWVGLVGGILGALAGAADSPVSFGETSVTPNVVTQDAAVAVSIPLKPEPGWRYLAYSVGVYRPCAPTACAENAPWPLSKSKHGAEWDSYTIRKWTWHSRSQPQPATLEFTLNTAGWPPGDYGLYVSLLFRNDTLGAQQGNSKRDRYLPRPILLSVLRSQ